MEPVQFLNLAAVIVGTLFSILTVVIGWIGNKLYEKLNNIQSALVLIESELRREVYGIDRRVTRLETKLDIMGEPTDASR